MLPGDEEAARAFWRHMRHATGEHEVSWNTFSASFETYMRKHHADEVDQVPEATPVEMVLRYAFDRGNAARAAAGERVRPRHLCLFLERFGPMRNCLVKASRSLFDDSGCLVPWFHGTLSRDEATKAIKDWEASSIDGSRKTGVFLFRYSDRQPMISFSYRRAADKRIMSCLISNGSRGYVVNDNTNRVWEDLGQFVRRYEEFFVHPVPSRLNDECAREIEDRRLEEQRRRRTPSEEIVDIRRLFDEAQTLLYSPGGQTVDTLEEVLSMVEEVVSRLRRSELGNLGLGELSLQAKALKLAGGILWNLGRKERSVRRYLECLKAAAAVQDHQDATHDESTSVTTTMLSPVHQVLMDYYLEIDMPDRALYYFSEMVACTTDHDTRQDLLARSRGNRKFERATEGLTHANVESMLDEGINHFRRVEYETARVKFELVLRNARCIGDGEVEARALGNLATIDYKTQRFVTAIRRYMICLQLLRQQGNEATERRILNYLVTCCIEAKRWAPARRFLNQLSRLAASEENLRTLERLEDQVNTGEEGQWASQRTQLRQGASPRRSPTQTPPNGNMFGNGRYSADPR